MIQNMMFVSHIAHSKSASSLSSTRSDIADVFSSQDPARITRLMHALTVSCCAEHPTGTSGVQ